MKSIIKRFIFSVACLAVLCIPCYAQTYTEGAFYYEIEGESITITGYFGREEEIVVPETIAGYPVNRIGSGAFSKTENVKIIHLPGTITEIQENAFRQDQQIVYAENHPANRGSSVGGDGTSSLSETEDLSGNSGGVSDSDVVIITVGDVSDVSEEPDSERQSAEASGSGFEEVVFNDDKENTSEVSEIAEAAEVQSDISSEAVPVEETSVTENTDNGSITTAQKAGNRIAIIVIIIVCICAVVIIICAAAAKKKNKQ